MDDNLIEWGMRKRLVRRPTCEIYIGCDLCRRGVELTEGKVRILYNKIYELMNG